MKRYEGLFILNGNLTSAGKDDGVTLTLDKITKDIEAAGGKVEGTQKMDRRPFTRVADKKFTAGHYVNIIFSGPPTATAALHLKFGLNEDIFRVLFSKAPAPAPASSKAPAK